MDTQKQQMEEVQVAQPIVKPTDSKEFLLSKIGQAIKTFELQQRIAQMYSTSTIVPDSYQGNKNIGNAVIALDMAQRMNANPLMLMQNLYVVHGIPSFSSKFLIATVNSCGRFTPLRYEFKGDESTDQWACRCYAYETEDKDHKEPLYGDWISIGMSKKEGWYDKSGSKWKTMPGQMLRYRAAAFWQRVYAPEISMGFISTEEAEDARTVEDAEYEEINSTRHIGFSQPTPNQSGKVEDSAEVEKQPANTQAQAAQPVSEQPEHKKSASELFAVK